MDRPNFRHLSGSPFAVTFLLTAFAAAPVAAQSQFRELGGDAFAPATPYTRAVAAADLDGDGVLDVVAAAIPPVLYRGLGGGRFALDASSFPSGTYYPSGLALCDVDGDGDLDVVIANLYYPDRLLLNDGTGRFAFAPFPVDADWSRDVTAFDADGDGDLDLAFAVSTELSGGVHVNRLYLNDGSGGFTDVSAARLPGTPESTRTTAAGDVDGDGDVDLFNVNYPGTSNAYSKPCSLWLNDGTGTFGDATAAKLPSDGIQGSDAAFFDVDGDGDLDLFVAADQRNGDRDTIYTNDGTGGFTRSFRVSATDAQAASEIALGDVDRDGDVDALLASTDGYRFLSNDGFGRFALASPDRVTPAQEFVPDLTLVDVDADGDLDALAATLRGVGLQVNDGLGILVDATSIGFPWIRESAYAVAAADFDGDGDADAAFGTSQGIRLVTQIGPGQYRSTGFLTVQAQILAIATPDIDGDGDPDLLVGGYRKLALWINDGRGGFTDVTASSFPFTTWIRDVRDLAVGDVDSDGDLDVLVARNGTPAQSAISLLLNRGNTTFDDSTATNVPAIAGRGDALALGDVDGDGDLDLVVGNGGFVGYGEQNRLLLNNGQGVFTDATAALPQVADATTAVELADLTGDGAPELIVANDGERNRLHLNLGNGTFVDVSARALAADVDSSQDVVVANLDDDPDLELVFAQGDGQSAGGLYDWTPTGYRRVTGGTPGSAAERAVAAQDLDGDGDLDLLMAREHTTSALWWNLQRQLHAPDIAQLGRMWRLQVHAADPTPRNRQALPLLSLTLAPRGIAIPPLGLLHLDPAALGALPPVAIPFQAPATVPVAIPAIPSLAGLRVHAQAVVLVTGAPLTAARLTNLVTDRMIR